MPIDLPPPDPQPDTARLAREISAGELKRFDELYERISPALFAWARLKLLRELRSVVDPQDVVQEVWIRALEIFPRFDAGRAEFRPWLFSVAKRVLMEATRRHRAARHRPRAAGGTAAMFALDQVPESVTGISTRLARDESIGRFVEAVQDLEPVDRQILVHFGLEGLTGEEVAKRVGVSRDAAFKRWQRLRKRMDEGRVGEALLVD